MSNEKTLLQERILEHVDAQGSFRAAAEILEVDHTYLYNLSTGKKNNPNPGLLRRLGLRRVVSYESTEV